jgi:uncharacterized protein (DUF1778 family)
LRAYGEQPYIVGMAISPSPPAERKSDRLELRVTPSVKALIQRASAISGLSAGELAYEAARRVLEAHEVMELSEAAAEAFAEALINPPEPTEALVAAFQRHAQVVRSE